MRRISFGLLAACVAATFTAPSFADPDKDESGWGRRRYERGEYGGHYGQRRDGYKEEYRDGNCKAERKVGKNGEYKEERECRGHARDHGPYHGGPVYGAMPEPGVYVQPPTVVIQPPGMVIR